MRKAAAWLFMASALFLLCGKSQKKWVGTYMLEVNDENRDVFNSFRDLNTPWPHVTLYSDGTFTLIQPRDSGRGLYRVEGHTLIMTLTEYDGGRPPGNLAQSKTIQADPDFRFIMFEGPQGVPWIRLKEMVE